MIDHELLLAISNMLDTKLDSKIEPLKADIQGMKADIQGMKADIQGMKADIQGMKADIQGMKVDAQEMKADIQGMKVDIEGMKAEINCLKLDNENVIKPQICLLAENYVPAAKRYEMEAAKIESMQSDIDVMKKVIAEHSEKLKKIS